jgi:hypothetical protein
LTGIDGDGLFGLWEWERAASVLARRVRPTARDVLRVGFAFSPRPVRRKRLAARYRLDLPWLKPDVLAAVNQAFCEWCAEEPFRWDSRTCWWAQGRYLRLTAQSFELLGEQAGAAVAHPFLDSGFISTLAHRGGWSGFGDRTRTMHALVGGLLPKKILARRGKATFTEAFWGIDSRALTGRWQGGGIPSGFVDEGALRETWSSANPNGLTDLLLQALWLATRPVS